MKRCLSGLVVSALTFAALPAGPARAAANEDLLPESVGTFSAAYLYQTYLGLVMLAEAKARDTFNEKTAADYLQTTVNLLELTDGQLAKLLKTDLSKERKDFLIKLQVAGGLLKKQAGLLKTYWSSREAKDLEKLDDARKDSWAKIGEVLGIK